MRRDWRISPYVVGLLLDAPDEIAPHMVRIYTEAEAIATALGLHPQMEPGRAIHATYLAFAAINAANDDDPELGYWLDLAARRAAADLGADLAALIPDLADTIASETISEP